MSSRNEFWRLVKVGFSEGLKQGFKFGTVVTIVAILAHAFAKHL